jgi:hypothetical protein
MHKHPQKQSYVGSIGQTLPTNVSMTLCNWQICHQTRVFCGPTTVVPNQIRYQIDTFPTPAVAGTKGVAFTVGRGGGVRARPPHLRTSTEVNDVPFHIGTCKSNTTAITKGGKICPKRQTHGPSAPAPSPQHQEQCSGEQPVRCAA